MAAITARCLCSHHHELSLHQAWRCQNGHQQTSAVQAFVIEYEKGIRVIVHTANLIRIDFDNKTQAVWWQDFPRKVRTKLATLHV